jgi:cytochrome P450
MLESAADFRDPRLLADPYPVYRRLAGRVSPIHDAKANVYYVCNYADVTAILRDDETFSSKVGGFESTLIYQDGKAHARIRKRLMPLFSPAKVDALEASIESLSESLVDAVLKRGDCDFVAEIGARLPAIVVSWMLGLGHDDIHRFPSWANALSAERRHRSSWWKRSWLRRKLGLRTGVERAAVEIRSSEAFIRACLSLDKDEQQRDVHTPIDVVLDEDALTEAERSDLVLVLVVAGTETTANLIANATLLLARDEHLQAQLRSDLSLLDTFVDEVLRYDAPVQRKGRVAVRDGEVGGTRVPAGARLELMLGLANRDPAAFDAPFEFRPERSPNRHLTFGVGPHFCLGQRLARLEARLILKALLSRTAHVRLAPSQGEIQYGRNFSVRGPMSLRLRISEPPRGERTSTQAGTRGPSPAPPAPADDCSR